MSAELPFIATSEVEVELELVVDLGLARALWEGVPTGRLLARVRLHRDERDLERICSVVDGFRVEIGDGSLLPRGSPSLMRG